MTQIGHYGPGELEYLIAHDNTILAELQDVSWDYDQKKEPGGTGLGHLHNDYHKRTGAPEGKFSISRNALGYSDKGTLFLKLLTGAGIIISENVAIAATTWTPGQTPWSIIEIKLNTSGTILKETDDYTVNWATGVVTFNIGLTEAATGKYISGDADWIGVNLIQNTGIEDDITNQWAKTGGANVTATRSATALYVGSYGLYVYNAGGAFAQNDGAQYDPNIAVVPGRTYRFSFWCKASAADDTFTVKWTDAGGATSMTPVGTAATLSVTWKLHEFTFTPDEATILNIQILNAKAVPTATYNYIDELRLRENAPKFDVMRSGLNQGFQFDILVRRTLDGVIVRKLQQCEVYSGGMASGDAYKEKMEGQFLRCEVLDV
jgi:hypothetical protein